MPFHTQAGLASKNKFIFEDEMANTSDEDVPMDPSELMNKATTNAVKNAKAQAKIEAAKAKAVAPKVVVQEQPAKKREPKANNQPRKGPRRERIPKENVEDKDGFVATSKNDNAAPAQRDNNRRQNRRPKNADKKSGDPRTGRKAYEKRGGAGAGNWGKADENLDEAVKQLDQENVDAEKAENDAENAAENVEEESSEPKIEYLTLEEYEASMNAGDANVQANKENVRVANDGQSIKGRQVERKKVYNSGPALKSDKAQVRDNAKQVINADFVGHAAGGRERGDDRRRGGNNKNEKKNFNNKRQGKMAAIDDVKAFPALGK